MNKAPSDKRHDQKVMLKTGKIVRKGPKIVDSARSGVFAALDLGTNNCRMMIAQSQGQNIRIIESFSRIVRLGEGLSHSGRLDERAMERTIRALKICADKIDRREATTIRAVATQACRIADNGKSFINRIRAETGLNFTIITPEQEANLAVIGCTSLLNPADIDRHVTTSLVIDVGGGSTEISWVDLSSAEDWTQSITNVLRQGDRTPLQSQLNGQARRLPKPEYYISIPVGVVNLSEKYPEPEAGDKQAWFEAMVSEVEALLSIAKPPPIFMESCLAGECYIVGTSGAITSLAGLHLGLERYDRSKVDGTWLQRHQCHEVLKRLLALSRDQRENEPCIGRDRADLVLAGAAILEALQRLWPCEDLRVADRGLREGLLLSMLRKKTQRRPNRRRRNRSKSKLLVD